MSSGRCLCWCGCHASIASSFRYAVESINENMSESNMFYGRGIIKIALTISPFARWRKQWSIGTIGISCGISSWTPIVGNIMSLFKPNNWVKPLWADATDGWIEYRQVRSVMWRYNWLKRLTETVTQTQVSSDGNSDWDLRGLNSPTDAMPPRMTLAIITWWWWWLLLGATAANQLKCHVVCKVRCAAFASCGWLRNVFSWWYLSLLSAGMSRAFRMSYRMNDVMLIIQCNYRIFQNDKMMMMMISI